MPDPQKQDYFSQFEEPKDDYFSQFEEVPSLSKPESNTSLADKVETGIEGLKWTAEQVPVLRRLFFGPNEEDLGGKKLIAPGMEPGPIPGVGKATDYLRNKLIDTGNYGAGYVGGLLKEWMPGIINNAFDPANAAIKRPIIPEMAPEEIPVKQGVPVEEGIPPKTALPSAERKLLGPGVYNVSPAKTLNIKGGTVTSPPEAGVNVPTEIPSFSMRERLKGQFHTPTDADGVVTVKKDANLPPQIKDAEIVSEVPNTPTEEGIPQIPTAAIRKPVQEYIDGVKNGSIDRSTGYSDWLANKPKPSLAEKLKSEQGSIVFKKVRGVDQKTADGIREEIISSLIQGGRLDLEGLYGKTPGVSRNQFNSIVDEIIDTGVVPKIAENIKVNTPEPIQRLLGALRDSKINSALQAAQLSAERAQRFGEFTGALKNVEGKEGFFGAASKMSGEYGKVSPTEFQLGQADTDALFKQIANNKRITPGEKLRAGFALRDLLDGTRVLQRNELALMDRVYGPGVGDQIMMMHGGLGGVPIQIAKTANTMKSMRATFDLSAPFRQGAGLALRKEFWNAFVRMHKYAGSHEAFMAQEAAMEAHPNYLLSRDAGLFTADHEMGNYEEQFMNSYVNDIRNMGKVGKIITEPTAASERAYVGFLNKLRFDTFNSLIEKAGKASLEPFTLAEDGSKVPTKLGREIANYVNVATGRGNLGSLSKYGDALNTALFSPRLIASRLTILNPAYYVKASPFVRQEALKTLFALAGTSVAVSTLGGILGAQIKLKPSKENLTNPDYAKVKVGNTRLDPNAGLQQYIVAASQFLTGQATSGDNTYDTSKFGQPGRLGRVIGIGNPRNDSFLENKMSPAFSFADKLLAGKIDPSTRQPYNMFPGPGHYWNNETRKSFTPLLLQDLVDLAKNDSSLFTDFALGVLANYGMGLQTYGSAPSNSGLRAPAMNTKP